jgi:hypothetical protein
MNDNTQIPYGGTDALQCRICELVYVPDSPEDKERHEHEHRVLMCGGLPLNVREFLKDFGWGVAFNDGGFERHKEHWINETETAKRAVVFAYWGRALTNGIPENDFNSFMDAQFMFVDAMVARDTVKLERAQEAIKRWEKYAG